jgi:hypothetical protein
MPQTAVILVRIAVRVPEKSFFPVAGSDPECQVCAGPCYGACPIEKPPVALQVTAEMVAFFREHPDNN